MQLMRHSGSEDLEEEGDDDVDMTTTWPKFVTNGTRTHVRTSSTTHITTSAHTHTCTHTEAPGAHPHPRGRAWAVFLRGCRSKIWEISELR